MEEKNSEVRPQDLTQEEIYKKFPYNMSVPVPEQYVRIAALWGEIAVRSIARANILLVGVGAVGSACFEGLVRSGVQNITVMDSDCFEPSNLNRQLLATHETLGRPKVEVAAERAKQINPYINVTFIKERLVPNEKEIKELLDKIKPTMVVDAIDDVPAKVALMTECVTRDAPIYDCSSMGAARREDLGEIKITNIMKTVGCPLAKAIRTTLRRNGVPNDKLEKWTRAVFSPAHAVGMTGRPFLPSCVTSTLSFGAALAHAALSILRTGETGQ